MTIAFRRSFLLLSTVSLLLVSGCGLLKKLGGAEADAEADAAVAVADAAVAAPAPAVAAAPVATNVDDVARFPDEKPLENVAATIQRPANVREIPSVGKIVAALPKGAAVSQLAQRTTFFLVAFDNPKDQKRVMGWVPAESFTAAPAVDAGVKALTCTAPEIALISDNPICGRVCTADTDCPSGQACKGAANKLTGGKVGDPVTVCTVFTPPVAAGGVKAVEPGKGGIATVADASTTPPATTPAGAPVDVMDPVGGKCDAEFALIQKDGKCHRKCLIADRACNGNKTMCIRCNPALKVCSANKDLCK